MEQVYPGMRVEDARGFVGFVSAVETSPEGDIAEIIVQRNDGTLLRLPPRSYAVKGDVVRIDLTEAGASAAAGVAEPRQQRTQPKGDLERQAADLRPGEELRVPIVREEPVVRTREVERGGVRINKTVDTREEVVEHPIFREEVDVERVPIGRAVSEPPAVREEGDTLIIPILEEQLVVEKRLVLKEEVRITRRRVEETKQARATLRAEQASIEQLDDEAPDRTT